LIITRFKHYIRNNPTLFRILWKRQETSFFKRRVLRPKDDIVIEGFPRSGNTFATYAFHAAYEDKSNLKIGNHFHSPAQFSLAKKYNIPALLLIRKPIDAVTSLTIYHNESNPKKYLLSYIYFHSPLIKIQSSFTTAKFEDVISNMGNIIENVNLQFNSNFNIPNHDQGFSDKIIKNIEQDRIKRLNLFGDKESSELRATIPSEKKNQLKKQIRSQLETTEYQTLIARANELYNTITE